MATYSCTMGLINERLIITNGTVRVWVLEYNSRYVLIDLAHLFQVHDIYLQTHHYAAGQYERQGLRVQFVRYQESFPLVVPIHTRHFEM